MQYMSLVIEILNIISKLIISEFVGSTNVDYKGIYMTF